MPRQLLFGFGNGDEHHAPPRRAECPDQQATEDIQCVRESLRPRILEYLRTSQREVGIRELRSALGFPGNYPERDPLQNPVNRILKEMRNAGEVACRTFDRGEPLFSLPEQKSAVPDAAKIRGNELAKRQLLVAAAGKHRVAITGPITAVTHFNPLIDDFGVPRSDDFEIMITVDSPTEREQTTKLAGTSSADIHRAIAQMEILTTPRPVASTSQTLLDRAIEQQFVPKASRDSILRVACTIASLDRSPTIEMAHVAEAINYAPRVSTSQNDRSDDW